MKESTKNLSLQLTLFLAMVATIILGIWVRLMVGFWYLLILGIPLLAVVILHFVFQAFAIRRVSKMKLSYIPLILLSNLFFFLSFALQIDFGDEPGIGGLAIVAFYDHYIKHGTSDYIPYEMYMIVSAAFLLALIVSWFFLLGNFFLKHEDSG